jgi:ABC-2 type transport system permease protein
MVAVFIREFTAYFRNITGFVFMGLFLALSGLFFYLMNLLPASPIYNNVLGNLTFVFLVVVPILTMRLLTEEKKQRTEQLLLTSPLSISGMVLGKYFAAQAVFLATLVVTFLYPFLLSLVGSISVAEIVGGYVGFFLLGSAFIALGLFVSSLTDNQVIAAVVTFGLLLFMWIIDWVQQGIPVGRVAGIVFAGVLGAGLVLFIYLTTRNLIIAGAVFLLSGGAITLGYLLSASYYDGFIIKFLQWFSVLQRYEEFNRGILAISPIVYYISFSTVFIFLTIRVIEKRRWR